MLLFPGSAFAQATYTSLRAHRVFSDFPFPENFEADYAIALYDSDGDGRISSYVGQEIHPKAMFPFLDSINFKALGNHIGAPVLFELDGALVNHERPGFYGRVLVYAEMIEGPTTHFVWFALRDSSTTVPPGYDPRFGIDFGFGTYSGNSDPRHASNVAHVTYVKDQFANNGKPNSPSVGHDALNWAVFRPEGTIAAPGHVFSTSSNPYAAWPGTWGGFTAGRISSDPYQNLFARLDRVVVDVPLVAEENWDGAYLFPAVQGPYGRTIQALGSAQTALTAAGVSHGFEKPKQLLGDFNGDGKEDVALWRQGWASTPVYFSDGNGDFAITNHGHSQNWINDPAAVKVVGDFNSDGRDDIALYRHGWQSIPIYFSDGSGRFNTTHVGLPAHQNWINQAGYGRLKGDFNGDGKMDILMFGQGWNSTPVYFSNGNGSFQVTNYLLPNGKNWINDPSTQKMLGDFNGDGRTDVALWREGWRSTPVYFSTGWGDFTVSNIDHVSYQNWINDPTTTKHLGDFDGDGKQDIMLSKSGWASNPVYRSQGQGAFITTNYYSAHDGLNDPMTTKYLGDFDGDGKTDVALSRAGDYLVEIFHSLGYGAFSRRYYPLPAGMTWINDPAVTPLVADFTGDGRMDIALRKAGWSSTPLYKGAGYSGFVITNHGHPSSMNWINQ